VYIFFITQVSVISQTQLENSTEGLTINLTWLEYHCR